MPWYKCTVNEVGPASDASETPDVVGDISLTDRAGGFAKTWFYAANGSQKQLLDVGIAAINGRKDVEVAATAPHPGNNPYTEISRIYGLRPQPPNAPTGFHEISLSPAVGTGLAVLKVGWTDNSDNETSFAVRYSGTLAGSPSAGERVVGADSVTASLSLIPEYTYNIYVAAVNSFGEAASNAITVTVPPPVVSAASLLAAVEQSPNDSSNFALSIEGSNFGANETVEVTVDWTVGNQNPVTFPLDPVTANQLGYFQHWFTGVVSEGFCPISVPFGEPQPPQTFHVRATGSASNKTASTSAGPFTCPFA